MITMAGKINFIESLKTIAQAIPYLREIAISIVLSAVIVGAIISAVLSGSITVPTAISDWLNTTASTVVTWLTSITGVVTVALGLLTVVVIMVLFRYFSGAGKKKGGDRM